MKVGEQVAVESSPVWSKKKTYVIREVAKLTNSFVVLDDGQRFYKGSYERWNRSVGQTSRLVPITSEIATEVAKSNAISFLEHMDWDLISSESIYEIVKIINSELKE